MHGELQRHARTHGGKNVTGRARNVVACWTRHFALAVIYLRSRGISTGDKKKKITRERTAQRKVFGDDTRGGCFGLDVCPRRSRPRTAPEDRDEQVETATALVLGFNRSVGLAVSVLQRRPGIDFDRPPSPEGCDEVVARKPFELGVHGSRKGEQNVSVIVSVILTVYGGKKKENMQYALDQLLSRVYTRRTVTVFQPSDGAAIRLRCTALNGSRCYVSAVPRFCEDLGRGQYSHHFR